MENLLHRVRAALAGRYEVVSEAGRGAMAVVYRAVDRRHDRTVAVKVLQPQLASAVGEERFLHEIRLAAGLAHPYVLPVLDSGEADGLLYYVMPFIEGETLAERLAREGELPVEDALKITAEIAEALGHAHAAGILHRDVKPSNILLTASHALLADFGVARALDRAGGEALTATGLSVGSPAYMSPQQADPEMAAGPRDDQYSLACVLYEMLTGAPPFSGGSATAVMRRHATDALPPLRTVRPAVPAGVEAAIERATAKSAADRFAGMEAFAAALDQAGGDARPARRATPIGLVGLVLAGLAALGSFIALGGFPRGPAPPAGDSSRYEFAVLPCRAAAERDTAFARNLASSTGSKLREIDPKYHEWWANLGTWRPLARTPASAPASTLDSLNARWLVDCELGPSRHDSSQVKVSVVGTEGVAHEFAFEVGGGDALSGSQRIAEELIDFVGGGLGSAASEWTANGFAWNDFIAGDHHFLNYDLAEADSLYWAALDDDPNFGLALWRLNQVHRWQWVEDTTGFRLDSLLDVDRDRFDPRDLSLLEALVKHWGPKEVALFQAMIDERPADQYTRLVYADELMHRGSLAEMGIRPDSAARVFAQVLAANPTWIAGWDHLTTLHVLLGNEDGARAALDALCQRRPSAPGDLEPCSIWTLGTLERFDPDSPKLAAARSGLPELPDAMLKFMARGTRYANLYDAQLHLGNLLLRRTAGPPSTRRSGMASVGIALAALGLPNKSIEVFANGADDPESRLFADMWAVVPAALGLEGFDGYERGAALRLAQIVGDEKADSLRRARAAWALALAADRAGDTAAFGRRRREVEALSPPERQGADRLSTVLSGVEAARRGDWDGALELTAPLLAYDSVGNYERPFGRAATYLLRGRWHREAGEPRQALAAWLWHWNTDFEGVPVSVQATEVDGAFAGWAHLRSARLADSLAADDPEYASIACREAKDGLYFWGGRDTWTDREPVEPAVAELVDELREIFDSATCASPGEAP